MKKGIIRKILPFTIVVLFVGMNLVSTVDSISLKKDVLMDSLTDTSIQNNCITRKEEPAAKPFSHHRYFNDLKVNAINSPVSGLANPQTPETVIENIGQFNQSANVNMVISKIQYGAQWTQEASGEWQQNNSNVAGGVAPEAYLPYIAIQGDYAYLMSCPIDTSAESTLTLSFRSMINDYAGGYNCFVKSRGSESDDWTDVSPWPNPISGNVYAAQYTVDVTGDISTTTQVMFEFSGYYWNLNYWYLDDFSVGAYSTDFSGQFPPVQESYIDEYNQTTATFDITAGETVNVSLPLWTPADLPFAMDIDYRIDASVSMNGTDENPADNELVKVITLSYEHDVGVSAITEPSAPLKAGDVIFHQGYWGVDESWAFNTAGQTLGYLIQEDFYGLVDLIGDVSWWGLSLGNNGGWFETSPALIYDIIFYEDNAGAPGAVVTSFIGVEPTYEDTGLDYNGCFSMYKWSFTLPEAVELTSGWISIQSEVPADLGNLMWATGPDGNINALQNGVALLQNMAYELSKAEGEDDTVYLQPGTYPVAGFAKNFGVTYPESNFSVNAKITWVDEGVVIYDETVTVMDEIFPGELTAVSFPNITFEDRGNEYDYYKLEMRTLLAGDDHPSNDGKTLVIIIFLVPPPVTYANISGTMGLNGWYVSCVTITFDAYDPVSKWPPGINHTYYKIDNGEWIEYTVPIIVCLDGHHIVYFYSVDMVGNVEETKSVIFKIDQTDPSISVTTEKVGFRQWKFIADASDATSGVELVEFYLDNMLLGNITKPGPYEWNWTGKGNHTVTAIAYDSAGNSAENSVVFSLSLSQNQYQGFSFSFIWGAMIQMLSRIIQVLHHLLINGK